MPVKKNGAVVFGRKKAARESRTSQMPGTSSTHLMESGSTSGKRKHVVNPTIFPNQDGTWTDLRNSPDKNAAYKEAQKRGEVYAFKSQKKAEKFAHGSWKKGPDKREAMKGYRSGKKK